MRRARDRARPATLASGKCLAEWIRRRRAGDADPHPLLKSAARNVDVDLAAGHVIVGQLHDVIEILARAADMQDVDETGMRARDRLETRHALETRVEKRARFRRCCDEPLSPRATRRSGCAPARFRRKRRGRSRAALRDRESTESTRKLLPPAGNLSRHQRCAILHKRSTRGNLVVGDDARNLRDPLRLTSRRGRPAFLGYSGRASFLSGSFPLTTPKLVIPSQRRRRDPPIHSVPSEDVEAPKGSG